MSCNYLRCFFEDYFDFFFSFPPSYIPTEVRIISRAQGKADNSYRDIDNLAYHKN